jgi:hypothetical protein
MVLATRRSISISKEDGHAHQDGLRLLALREKSKMTGFYYSIDQVNYDQALEQLREQMGDIEFQTVWAEGQTMTQDEGTAYAKSLLEKYAPREM